MTPIERAAWAAAAATFLAALVALLRDEIIALWRRPRFAVAIRLAAPDCHKTEFRVTNVQTGAVIDTWPCYYLRMWIENVGNVRAKQVQVFTARLFRKQADGTFRRDDHFLPMNLKWSHTGEVFAKGISPKMGKTCDFGHVVHPSKTTTAGHTLPGVPSGKVVLCLDLEAPPNTQSHLLAPGTYRLELHIAAANAMPVVKLVELTLTGDWFDDEATMFSQGLGFLDAS